MNQRQKDYLDFVKQTPGTTRRTAGEMVSGITIPKNATDEQKIALRAKQYMHSYHAFEYLVKKGLIVKKSGPQRVDMTSPDVFYAAITEKIATAPTKRQIAVMRFLSDKPGSTSRDVGSLYQQFVGTPTKPSTPTNWGYHKLDALRTAGLVYNYGPRDARLGWCWALTKAGKELFQLLPETSPTEAPTEVVDLTEATEITTAAVEIPATQFNWTTKRCPVQLPGLIGLSFHLLCAKRGRDPNIMAAEIIHDFLSTTEEYRDASQTV